MGRSAVGLITSRRAHEFGIESRTANGSVLSAPAGAGTSRDTRQLLISGSQVRALVRPPNSIYYVNQDGSALTPTLTRRAARFKFLGCFSV